jgi:hypothetical protein
MSHAPIQPRLPRFEPEIGRLAKLTAPQRAEFYASANLGLGERSMIEAEVRARIAAEFRRSAR